MSRTGGRWLVVAGLSLVTPRDARAYLCTRVSETPTLDPECPPAVPTLYGPSLAWRSRNLSFAVHAQGTNDIAGGEEFAVLAASFVPWEQAQECSLPNRVTDLRFTEGPRSNRAFVGYNFLDAGANENLLLFHDAAWPRPGAQSIIALTTTTFNPLTGEIFDSDIEFNSANNDFTVGDNPPLVAKPADLMNTAVHEIGHFIGLAHVRDPAQPGGCSASAPTMCASAEPGEISKRDLACDDKNGVVFKYPAAQANGYCAPDEPACGCCAPPEVLATIPQVTVTDSDDGTGCNASPARLALGLAGLLFFARRRRLG